MTRDLFFMIDGGLGRVICAQPALKKHFISNPETNSLVGIAGWDATFWGDPILQNKTYNLENKGVFENFIKPREIVSPEPYRSWSYYNQKKDLIKCFDEIINNTDNHDDLGIPELFLSKQEELFAFNLLKDIKNQKGKDKKIIVFQPFGRSAVMDNDVFIDSSSRSLNASDYIKLGKKLSKHCNIILFAEKNFHLIEDNFSIKPEVGFREWFSIIDSCDYFIGCDSVGQHIARSFNKKGTVILGSTFKENISYQDWFNIWEKPNFKKMYSPLRINNLDCMLADRINDKSMDLNDKELDMLFESIMGDINK